MAKKNIFPVDPKTVAAITRKIQSVFNTSENGGEVEGLWVCRHEGFEVGEFGFLQFYVDSRCPYINLHTLQGIQDAVSGTGICVGWDFHNYDVQGHPLVIVTGIDVNALESKLKKAEKARVSKAKKKAKI